jgi:hypothetical protein
VGLIGRAGAGRFRACRDGPDDEWCARQPSRPAGRRIITA